MSESRRKQQINHWGSVPGCLSSLSANIPTCAIGRDRWSVHLTLPGGCRESWRHKDLITQHMESWGKLRATTGSRGQWRQPGPVVVGVSPTLPAFCSVSKWLRVNSYSTSQQEGNAVGSRAGICGDHLMFLSVWHLFRLQSGKSDFCYWLWPRESGDWQEKVDYLGFLPPWWVGWTSESYF